MVIFRAFSALLSYPSVEMRQALPEIAEVVGVSVPTVDRELRFARAWLRQMLAS